MKEKYQKSLELDQIRYDYYDISALGNIDRLPYSLLVLLENLLRGYDGVNVTWEQIEAVLNWQAKETPSSEIQFMPARVVLQDFTGVPCVVDLAAMRQAVSELGGDPKVINPLIPAELVIDHSVQIDHFGNQKALEFNIAREYERNSERYQLLKWAKENFENFQVVPPGTGIVHQVNLEYLARGTFTKKLGDTHFVAYPDTCVGTDSHTTMINGLGVLGWGVGGIEAEAAMLGQRISMLLPQVVGFKLHGKIPPGATATDVVLTITQMLRKTGVVGKFVEFSGSGLSEVPLANRATIGNMSPEFGSTVAFFPIDQITLDYLSLTGRDKHKVELTRSLAQKLHLWHDPKRKIDYSLELELDLSTVVPSIAGPKRPQDRIELAKAKQQFTKELVNLIGDTNSKNANSDPLDPCNSKKYNNEEPHVPRHGDVAIASITSCTNTSNPQVMIAAGIIAKKAVEQGLKSKPWVKTSLAPGSQVVSNYLQESGLLPYLEQLGFHVVGYGCTTCIGNSGPIRLELSQAAKQGDTVLVSVLSGNRNFEGRINPDVRMNFLASPPLVIAYAIAGSMNFDIVNEPLGVGQDERKVFLKDIWPTQAEIEEISRKYINSDMFTSSYADVFTGDERWQSLDAPKGELFNWDNSSTYIRRVDFFDDMPKVPVAVEDIQGARVLLMLADSVTTDHISPAGAFAETSPAGQYLISHGVEAKDFNSYGSRRGNHELMIRGTFANIRIRNELVPGVEGGFTRYFPPGVSDYSSLDAVTVFEAASLYAKNSTKTIVIAGKEYGSGSSRDWAAKGPALLGVKAVIAESFERIHRSNLIGMGIVPLEFLPGESPRSLNLTGEEIYDIIGLEKINQGQVPSTVGVSTTNLETNKVNNFSVRVRIDTPAEMNYYLHGGILPYVLRSLLKNNTKNN